MKISVGISKMKILHTEQLNELGYEPTSQSGCFIGEQRPLEIVRRFPHLHIISSTKGVYRNYYAPGNRLYYISAGDPDPDLEVCAEAFTIDSYEGLVAMIKGDQYEITDPFIIQGLKFLRGFVSDMTPWEQERLGQEEATSTYRSSTNDHTSTQDSTESLAWLPRPRPKH